MNGGRGEERHLWARYNRVQSYSTSVEVLPCSALYILGQIQNTVPEEEKINSALLLLTPGADAKINRVL